MADHAVNSQITDAITQLSSLLVGKSAPQSMAIMSAVMADTMGIALHNAVSTQHHAQMIGGASTTSTCARMLGVLAPPPDKNGAQPPLLKSSSGSKFFDCDYCGGGAAERRRAGEGGEEKGLLSKISEMFKKHGQEGQEGQKEAEPPGAKEMEGRPALRPGEDVPGPSGA